MNKYSLLALAIGLSSQAFAVELDTQQVTGQLFNQPIAEQAYAVEVLDREDLAMLPISTVAEALEWVTGVDVRQRGAHGTQVDLGIRGAGYEQTLILIDGIRLNHPQTGHHNLDIPVVYEDIERIEVVRGPGAAQYGPNGNAGVINIVTRKTINNETGRNAKLALEGGSYGYGRAALALGKTEGKWSQFASASIVHADNYLSGHSLYNDTKIGNYRLSHQGEVTSTLFSLGFMNKDFGAQGFYTGPTAHAEEKTKQFQSYITHEHRFNQQQKFDLSFNFHKHEDAFYYLTYAPSEHETKAAQARVRFHLNSNLSLGYEFNKEQITSTSVIQGNQHSRHFDSAFIYGNYDFNWLQVAGSLSYLNYGDGNEYTLPVLGLSVPIGQHQLYANAGQSVRVPSMNDMFMNQSVNQGNPLVKPEETDSYELGARLNLGGVQARLAAFERKTENAIDFTRTQAEITANSAYVARNIDNINIKGYDIELDASSLLAEYSIKKLSLSYTRLLQDFKNSYPEARYSKSQLEHQAAANIAYSLTKNLTLISLYKYETRYQQEGFYLWDVALKQGFDRWHWQVSAANILNEKYIDSGYIQAPGTTAKFELGFDF